jgi:hypothetical protein
MLSSLFLQINIRHWYSTNVADKIEVNFKLTLVTPSSERKMKWKPKSN